MNKLVAKPVVNDQYWIVTDGTKKIGNIHLNNHNVYEVTLSGNRSVFTDKDELSKSVEIDFQSYAEEKKPEQPYPEYPTTKHVYNSVMDIQKGLHLYTKTKKSKCFHAAGYFTVNFLTGSQVLFCPKYIFLQRYDYSGPFKTRDEAASINS